MGLFFWTADVPDGPERTVAEIREWDFFFMCVFPTLQKEMTDQANT
jgi:hypothetical protein